MADNPHAVAMDSAMNIDAPLSTRTRSKRTRTRSKRATNLTEATQQHHADLIDAMNLDPNTRTHVLQACRNPMPKDVQLVNLKKCHPWVLTELMALEYPIKASPGMNYLLLRCIFYHSMDDSNNFDVSWENTQTKCQHLSSAILASPFSRGCTTLDASFYEAVLEAQLNPCDFVRRERYIIEYGYISNRQQTTDQEPDRRNKKQKQIESETEPNLEPETESADLK